MAWRVHGFHPSIVFIYGRQESRCPNTKEHVHQLCILCIDNIFHLVSSSISTISCRVKQTAIAGDNVSIIVGNSYTETNQQCVGVKDYIEKDFHCKSNGTEHSSHIPDSESHHLFGYSLKSSSFASSLAMLSGALLMNGPFVAITKEHDCRSSFPLVSLMSLAYYRGSRNVRYWDKNKIQKIERKKAIAPTTLACVLASTPISSYTTS